MVPPPELVRSLAGRYQFEGELGRGGMATVFRARDLASGRLLAIKVLRPEFAASTTTARFLREIRVTSRLGHANVLPLLDSGMVGECPWFAMPLVEGESLRARLMRAGGQLPLPDVIRIGSQVASALDHAHATGVVHRDIKPAVRTSFRRCSCRCGQTADGPRVRGLILEPCYGAPVFSRQITSPEEPDDTRQDVALETTRIGAAA